MAKNGELESFNTNPVIFIWDNGKTMFTTVKASGYPLIQKDTKGSLRLAPGMERELISILTEMSSKETGLIIALMDMESWIALKLYMKANGKMIFLTERV